MSTLDQSLAAPLGFLTTGGLHPGSQVEFIVAFLGAIYARAVAAPLNPAYRPVSSRNSCCAIAWHPLAVARHPHAALSCCMLTECSALRQT